MDRPQLADDRWLVIQPLLPIVDTDHPHSQQRLLDRHVFAVLAIVLLNDLSWRAGMRYGVSATTLRYRWRQWRAAEVFTRIRSEISNLTNAGDWAWRIAAASDSRAQRALLQAESIAAAADKLAEHFAQAERDARAAEHAPRPARRAGPTPDDYRLARVAQNEFAES
jgi:transposase